MSRHLDEEVLYQSLYKAFNKDDCRVYILLADGRHEVDNKRNMIGLRSRGTI